MAKIEKYIKITGLGISETMYPAKILRSQESVVKDSVILGRDGEVTIVEVEEREGGVTASYTGESGFSVAVRGAQHLQAMENPQSHGDNAFAKHSSNYHQGEEEEVQYGLELVGHFTKPVERLVCEGVYIHSDPSDLVMNDKLDHHLPAVARVTYSNSAADRGEGGGRGRGRGGGRGRRGSLRTTRPG